MLFSKVVPEWDLDRRSRRHRRPGGRRRGCRRAWRPERPLRGLRPVLLARLVVVLVVTALVAPQDRGRPTAAARGRASRGSWSRSWCSSDRLRADPRDRAHAPLKGSASHGNLQAPGRQELWLVTVVASSRWRRSASRRRSLPSHAPSPIGLPPRGGGDRHFYVAVAQGFVGPRARPVTGVLGVLIAVVLLSPSHSPLGPPRSP